MDNLYLKWGKLCKATVLAVVLIFSVSAAAQEQRSVGSVQNSDCKQAGESLAAGDLLFQASFTSSVLIALLSGNTGDAQHQLGAHLVSTVLSLYSILGNKKCRVSAKERSRIYSVLRVVAAVNHVTPIPELSSNKMVVKVLNKAVKNDPSHYKKLLKRAEHWKHGI